METGGWGGRGKGDLFLLFYLLINSFFIIFQEGDDLHLTPYKVIATGEDQGMIEVVLNSATVAGIQKAAGGVTGAFKQSTILNWFFFFG